MTKLSPSTDVSKRETVPIRDRRNPDRLLGTLQRRPTPVLNGTVLHVAVRAPSDPFAHPMRAKVVNPSMAVEKATFDVHFRSTADGYEKRAELHTDADLALLMQIPEFRLPGETSRNHDARFFRW